MIGAKILAEAVTVEHQAVGSLPIKQTVCLSPWVPTQQTLRAGREAAQGLHIADNMHATSENVNYDSRAQKKQRGIFNDFPKTLLTCRSCVIQYLFFLIGSTLRLGKNVIVHTAVQHYTDRHT